MGSTKIKPGHRRYKRDDIQIIYSGVDWLALSTPNMLCEDVLKTLAEMRADQDAGKDVRELLVTFEAPDEHGELVEREIAFELLKGGTNDGFSYRLMNNDLEIYARSTPVKIESMPNVRFRARNDFLHRMDWTKAYLYIEHLAQAILDRYGEDDELKISRVDLFVDCQGFDLDLFAMRDYMCPPSRTKSTEYRVGSRSLGFSVKPKMDDARDPFPDATGFSVGKSAVQLRVYDKTEEIETNSFKSWFYDIYDQCEEYDKERRVTRVEFEIRREKLTSLKGANCPEGISTVRDLVRNHAALWRYLCGEGKYLFGKKRRGWVTARLPSFYKDKKRWPEHPWWLAIREYAVEAEPLHRIETVPIREAEAYKPQFDGVGAAMISRMVSHSSGDPAKFHEEIRRRENFEDRMPKALADVIRAGFTDRERSQFSRKKMERTVEAVLAMDGISIDWDRLPIERPEKSETEKMAEEFLEMDE